MAFCSNCGAKLPDGAAFCGYCGSPVSAPAAYAPQSRTNYAQPTYSQQDPPSYGQQNQPTYNQTQYGRTPNSQGQYSQSSYSNPPNYSQARPAESAMPSWARSAAPEPYNTTGLWIWSVLCVFMLLIPGVIAISNTSKINKCDTAEEQQKHIRAARIACIVGTVLGILIIIGQAAQGG